MLRQQLSYVLCIHNAHNEVLSTYDPFLFSLWVTQNITL